MSKVILVTGSSRGIGRAICKQLAKQGYSLISTYKSSTQAASDLKKEIEESTEVKVHPIQMDLSNPASIARVADEAKSISPEGIHGVVNSAGLMCNPGAELHQHSVEDLLTQINTGVSGPLILMKHLIPLILPGGQVINIGSFLGKHGSAFGMVPYVVSKSAMNGLTRALCYELNRFEIRVNQISPGPIDTDMNPISAPSASPQIASNPLGRFGRPEEISELVGYLFSNSGSYFNGADIVLDGGSSL